MLDNIALFQESLEYKFKNQDLLKTALTHRSYSCEYSLKYCNERMEFLGDSILSAIVCEYLYNKYSQNDEGKLSQIKAQIVSSKNLSKWAKKIKLDKFVLISKSEEQNSARNRESLLCDSFEAVTGAIFLDSNFETVSKFINEFLSSQKDITITDYKKGGHSAKSGTRYVFRTRLIFQGRSMRMCTPLWMCISLWRICRS